MEAGINASVFHFALRRTEELCLASNFFRIGAKVVIVNLVDVIEVMKVIAVIKIIEVIEVMKVILRRSE